MTDSRDWKATTPHHIHGGAPLKAFERLKIRPHKTVDFSVNVSPLGPPRILFENWNRLSGEILNYPTVNGDGIADYYISRFNLERNHILAGNGSTECIYLVPRALKLTRVAIVTPSFHDYERSCRLAGAEIVEIPLSAANGFAEPDSEVFQSALTTADAIVLGNPNNPTGTLCSPQLILELSERFPEKWILVDEAFVQFLDDYEFRTLAAPDKIRKNILVFHSLTKLYDIPGIRAGCVIGHPETIERLNRIKEPWTVNGIAETVAKLLIGCGDYEHQLRALLHRERRRFVEMLGNLEGLILYPSPVNYMLARWNATDNLDYLLRILLSNGYHVRDCRNFRQLEQNYFRFALLKATDNEKLIALITRAAKEARR